MTATIHAITDYLSNRDDPPAVDLTTERPAPADAPGPRDPYVIDLHGALDRKVTMESRAHRRPTDPAVLIDDLLEIRGDDRDYEVYADGMTRRYKGEAPGTLDCATGRELRPGFVSFLDRRNYGDDDAGNAAVTRILEDLRAAGGEERKWALAVTLRLLWGLTHQEIARETKQDRSTVSKHLKLAEVWLSEYIAREEWVWAYIAGDAAVRMRIVRKVG